MRRDVSPRRRALRTSRLDTGDRRARRRLGALAYAERWLGAKSHGPVTLLVEDETTGRERCLTLDLTTGEATPCGWRHRGFEAAATAALGASLGSPA